MGSAVDWISSGTSISGCESGWTVYLEEVLEQSPHLHSQSHFRRHRTVGSHTKDEDNDDDDDDPSMVSDASSGPPHFPESDANIVRAYNINNYDSFTNYYNTTTNPAYAPAGGTKPSRSKSSTTHVKTPPRRTNYTNRSSSLAISTGRSSRTEDDYLATVSNQHTGSNLQQRQQQQQQQLDDTASSPFYGPCYKVVMKNGGREELSWM